MKKIILSVSVVAIFALYSLGVRSGQPAFLASSKDSTEPDASVAAPPASTAANTSSAPSQRYKDGTYTGSVADAFYGNIQVQAIIKDGRITAVKFLQYPNDRPNSIAINQEAMPFLQQEAIKAQSARVDGVSGATDTSTAFEQSLAAALSQAM